MTQGSLCCLILVGIAHVQGERGQGLPDRPLLATEIRFIEELFNVYWLCIHGLLFAVRRIIVQALV